jgi:hypothetical protein
MKRMIDALAVPAIVLTARWDVIAWNSLTKVIRDYGAVPLERRNLLRILLVEDEVYRNDPDLYEATARRILAKFRVDYSQAPGDPAFEELIADLSAACPIFDRLWGLAEVVGTHEAIVTHPRAGLTFEHSSYVPEGYPKQRLIIFTPCNEASIAKVREALAESQQPAGRRSSQVN